MRVVIAHSRYRDPGGEERHIELLEQGLRQAGVEVARFERGAPGAAYSRRSRFLLAAGLAYRPSAERALFAELERRPAEVVHFHNLLPHLTPSALRAAKRAGAATALTVHNYRFACPAGTLVRNGRLHDDCIDGSSLACGLRNSRGSLHESLAYGLALELHRRLRLVPRWVDAYVAPSDFVARLLARAGFPQERIHVIPHGLPPAPEPTGERAFALFAGRLTAEKGVETLLAASRLAPEVPLVVVGDGPLAPEVRQAVNGTVSYLERLDPAELARLRRRAAFAVAPSEGYEVLPLAAVESLAAGVPLIATPMGGLRDIVDDGVSGVLVPPGDPEALAAAMRALWADPARATELGANARRIAAERFSLEGQTRRLLDLYAEVVR